MFCRQCEQTFRWVGCETMGVCGKDPEVAALQDLLIHVAKGCAVYGAALRAERWTDQDADYMLLNSVFATLTNVNFDALALEGMIRETALLKDKLQKEASTWGVEINCRG